MGDPTVAGGANDKSFFRGAVVIVALQGAATARCEESGSAGARRVAMEMAAPDGLEIVIAKALKQQIGIRRTKRDSLTERKVREQRHCSCVK